MAYKSCAAKIAASIQQDCNKPLVGGYTGRAVIMSVLDFERAEVVRSATNPRKIMSIVLPVDGSAMAYTIDNVFATPFTGSTTAGNNENGRNGYLKTVSVRVPMRGADTSMKVIEPLVKDPNGFVMVLEKRDKVGDGSYEVIGYQNALRGDIAGVTRDESANGGDWIVPLKTVEKWAEVDLVGAEDTYESAKKEFDGLFSFEPKVMRMVLTEDSGGQVQLSANGTVIVDYTQGGKKVRNTYTDLSNTYVPIPAGVEATVYGSVTAINDDGNGNIFSSLDLSKNTALKYLDCNVCTGLTALDLSKNTALKYLYCSGCTGLTSLDIQNTALTSLDCSGCTGLTALDLSKNTALTHLDCNGCTGLTALDLSKNTALTSLDCYECTGLTALDLSKNTALTHLDCNVCTGFTALDLSKNTALKYLYCSGCIGLTALDLSKNTALISLNCSGCTGLTSLDIQNTSKIENGDIFTGISTTLKTLKVAGTSALAYTQVENWLKGNAPSNGQLYADENTPQEVITAATAKNWDVIR